jgi:hypothetical protein
MVKPLFLAVMVVVVVVLMEAASGVVVHEYQNYYREGYRTVTGVSTRQFC